MSNKTIFVKYNSVEEKRNAFRRSVNLRKEWESKMSASMETYVQSVSAGKHDRYFF